MDVPGVMSGLELLIHMNGSVENLHGVLVFGLSIDGKTKVSPVPWFHGSEAIHDRYTSGSMIEHHPPSPRWRVFGENIFLLSPSIIVTASGLTSHPRDHICPASQ